MRYLSCLALAGGSFMAACGGGGVTDTPRISPPDTVGANPPGGAIQRSILSARVTVDAADASLAGAVGLSIEGLTVRLLREGTPATSATAVTDAAGSVRFENLLEGRYSVSVERGLSTEEQLRLPVEDRDASVFAGGSTVDISPPQAASTQIALVASRRGSLVISEQYGYTGVPTPYNWGMYMEFYNNGDTTVYMDGMLLVSLSQRLTREGWGPCSHPTFTRFRRDTSRVWIEGGIRFPGSGRQFPVLPGHSVVYAQDAVNHAIASGSPTNFIDLSRATFEGIGNDSDSDNPLSANVEPIFDTRQGAGGRGFRPRSHSHYLLVSSAAWSRIDSARVDRVTPPPVGAIEGAPFFMVYGIPAQDVIDVMSLGDAPAYRAYMASTTLGDVQPCPPVMESVFDRAPAPVSDYRMPVAARRRTIGRTADGRPILMRTRTSARDIEAVTRLRERFP